MKERILDSFEKYLDMDKNNICHLIEMPEVFVGNSLSEAWLKARPQDAYRFDNKDFQHDVDSSNGKWLEKQSSEDHYKIILSTKFLSSTDSVFSCFCHEAQHCSDYQNAVKDLPFEKQCAGDRQFTNWSEFRSVMTQIRSEFFLKYNTASQNEMINYLSSCYGKWAVSSVEGLLNNQNNAKWILYYLSRFIGAARAIRNLSVERNLGVKAFHIWSLVPHNIDKLCNNTFYIANEFEEMEHCLLKGQPLAGCYQELINKLSF